MSGSVTFDKHVDDLIGTYRDWFWANLRRHPVKRLIRLAVCVAVLLLLGWQWNLNEPGDGDVLYGAAGGVLLILPVCWALSYMLLPRRVRRIFSQQRLIDTSWSWHWSEEGLASSNANGDNHYQWREFYSWLEGRHAIMFFLTEHQVFYVPRRVLNADQASDLTRIARNAGIPRF